MKKILAIIAAAILPMTMFAQAQITTKKLKIADFTDKTTKIVLTGNTMFGGVYQKVAREAWTVSPYEFCTQSDFEKLKSDPDYYFLMIVTGQFKKEAEPGIELLGLFKGGMGSSEGVNEMLEVATIPFRPVADPEGREYVMLPALLQIIQQITLDCMEKDINSFTGLSNSTNKLSGSKQMRIAIANEDCSEEINKNYKLIYGRNGIEFMDVEDVDDLMDEGAANTLVSYIVAPIDAVVGSYCYKMLISCEDHSLYMYRRHRIGKKSPKGLLVEDFKKIESARQ